jgi:hypothetical protein
VVDKINTSLQINARFLKNGHFFWYLKTAATRKLFTSKKAVMDSAVQKKQHRNTCA